MSAPRRRAVVRKTPDGWVANLAGGSVSSPFPTWTGAFVYAWQMTDMYCRYWLDERPKRGDA